MRIPPFNKRSGRRVSVFSSAFTLPELLVAMTVFILMITGILYVHLFGLRINGLVRAKLGASDEARAAISKMVSEVRSAGVVKIGNGSPPSFTWVESGLQQGNALQVQMVKGNTNSIVYFWDGTDQRLKRSVNGGAAVQVVANAITNRFVFTGENFEGKTNFHSANNRVISLTLEFFQLQHPTIPIGPGAYYDYYALRTKMTRRAHE